MGGYNNQTNNINVNSYKNNNSSPLNHTNLNNFPKQIETKPIGVIDYGNLGKSQLPPSGNIKSYNQPAINTQNKSNFLKDYQSDIKKSSSTPSINNPNILSKSVNLKQGPIKIQQDEIQSNNNYYLNNNINTIKKSNNYYSSTLIKAVNHTNNLNSTHTQMRSNSVKQSPNSNSRPSTAPSKEDKINETSITNNNQIRNSMQRLPSPNVKSTNIAKNIMSSTTKYRSPSPSNTISNNKQFLMKGYQTKKLK